MTTPYKSLVELLEEDKKVHGSVVGSEEEAHRHLVEGRELHCYTGEEDTLHIAEFVQYTERNVGTLTADDRRHIPEIEDFGTLRELLAACRKVAEWRCWTVYCPHE